MVQGHVGKFVHHLPFHLEANHLLDLAGIGEGQFQDTQGGQLARESHIDGGAGGQLVKAAAQG